MGIDFNACLLFGAAALAVLLAMAGLVRAHLTIARVTFAAGMAAFAAENVLAAWTFMAVAPEEIIGLQRLRLLALSVQAGTWLLFSLTYSRNNFRDFLRSWRWVLALAFVAPIGTVIAGWTTLFTSMLLPVKSGIPVLTVGPAAALLHVAMVICTVLTLMNLEQTLRSAVGTMRWRIKFMVIGLAVFLSVRIYAASQVLLYSSIVLSLQSLIAAAFFVGGVLILRGLYRAVMVDTDVFVSHSVLHRSLTVLLAGVYLLGVGVFARVVVYLGRVASFPLDAFLVFLALAALAVVAASDRARQWFRRFLGRHFRRPQYDYRKVWETFARRTATLTDATGFCREVARLVSEILEALSVTVWLVDDAGERLVFGSSTSMPESRARSLAAGGPPAREFIGALRQADAPVDIDGPKAGTLAPLKQYHPDDFPEKGGHRICVPLSAGGELLGVMTVGDRVNALPYTAEEFDLLGTIGSQVAAGLLNLRLSQRLLDAKQFEAFQAMSTFFVHDLKNTASTLSLMLQNLPQHFDDPEFREDALKAVSRTVNRINDTVRRLSGLRQQLLVNPVPGDFSALVRGCLKGLQGACLKRIEENLGDMPDIAFDADAMQKVVVNLLLNACEASSRDGRIRIETSCAGGWAILTVADDGCGMPPDFIANRLFRPFQTSKKEGMGIGLYQSRMIVEAHRGKIEVESVEGKGSTFRVLLPATT